MKMNDLYSEHPRKDVPNIGVWDGYLENIVTYIGMAYVKTDKNIIKPLCLSGDTTSMFIWSEHTLEELKKRDGNL